MGCFPACFGHLRHKQIMKNGPDQCLCPSNELQESVNLLPPASTESLKEEEIVNPMKINSESDECKKDKQTKKSNVTSAIFDHSKVDKFTNEVSISNSDNDVKSVEKDKKKEITLSCPVEEAESSESLFSLSIDSRKHVFGAEMGEKEVNSALKKSNDFSVKSVEKTPLKFDEDDKENVNVPLSKDFTTKQSFNESKKPKRSEVAVDTSLSSWLLESEKLPKEMMSIGNSPESEKNYGERGVLGAIASPMEFKEMNGISIPCCSADDHLGIGTVGSYWQQTGGAGEVAGSGSVSGSGSSGRGSRSLRTNAYCTSNSIKTNIVERGDPTCSSGHEKPSIIIM